LSVVSLLAGAINSIAGAGTLLTFPVLYSALGTTADAAVMANATNTVSLVPAAGGALAGYRREFAAERYWSWMLLGPSLLGGMLGALLVVVLPPESFQVAVPWLILAAAVLFALQPQISRWTGMGASHARPSPRVVVGAVFFQFCVGLYGGYFGAGMGILMLAALAVIGIDDIHHMNAVKSLLGAAIKGTAVVIFVVTDKVHWPFAVTMAIAATIGGYLGAYTARRVNRTLVRRLVVTLGFALAAYYFYLEFAR
jgi:uncharacterized membrane protein YfcA